MIAEGTGGSVADMTNGDSKSNVSFVERLSEFVDNATNGTTMTQGATEMTEGASGENSGNGQTQIKPAETSDLFTNFLSRAGAGVSSYVIVSRLSGALLRHLPGLKNIPGMQGILSNVLGMGSGLAAGYCAMNFAGPLYKTIGNVLPGDGVLAPVKSFFQNVGESYDTVGGEGGLDLTDSSNNVVTPTNLSERLALGRDPEDSLTFDENDHLEFMQASMYVNDASKLAETLEKNGYAVGTSGAVAQAIENGDNYSNAMFVATSALTRGVEYSFEDMAADGIDENDKKFVNDYANELIDGIVAYSNGCQKGISERFGDDEQHLQSSMSGLEDINRTNVSVAMESLAFLQTKYNCFPESLLQKLKNSSVPGVENFSDTFNELYKDYQNQVTNGADLDRQAVFAHDPLDVKFCFDTMSDADKEHILRVQAANSIVDKQKTDPVLEQDSVEIV